jgi:hypothetical protein
MSVRILSENGVQTLDKEPRAGYQEGAKVGNLAKVVLHLSDLRPDDWCPWLSSKLSQAYPGLSYGMAACLGCLAYVRRPVPVVKLEEWTAQLIGDEYRDAIAEAIRSLKAGTTEFALSVRIIRGGLQLNSNYEWKFLPEVGE